MDIGKFMKFNERFTQILANKKSSEGITQEIIAKRMGISRSTLTYWLAGKTKPNTENIEKLARALNVPVSELWGDKQPGDLSSLDYEFSKLSHEQKQFVLKLFNCLKDSENLRDYFKSSLFTDK